MNIISRAFRRSANSLLVKVNTVVSKFGLLKIELLILSTAYIGPFVTNFWLYYFVTYIPKAEEIDTGANFAYGLMHFIGVLWAVMIILLGNGILEVAKSISKKEKFMIEMAMIIPMITMTFIVGNAMRLLGIEINNFNHNALVNFYLSTVIELMISITFILNILNNKSLDNATH